MKSVPVRHALAYLLSFAVLRTVLLSDCYMEHTHGGDDEGRGRLKRRPHVHAAIEHFDKTGVDIVVLQELNSFRAGLLTGLLYHLLLFLGIHWPKFQSFLEVLMCGEGCLFPIFLINNVCETIEFVKKSTSFRYVATSALPKYWVNGGLMILSRHPFVDSHPITNLNLKVDSGNRPAALSVTIQYREHQLRVITCHLVPTLLNTTTSYRMVNFFNYLIGRDCVRLRQEHARDLVAEMDLYRCHSEPESTYVLLAGDLNISEHSKEFKEIVEQLQLTNIPMKPLLSTTDELLFPGEGQIDFVLLDPRLAQSEWTSARLDDMFGSDHYALQADLPLSTKKQ